MASSSEFLEVCYLLLHGDLPSPEDKQKFKDFWINYSDNVSIGDPIERWDTYNNIPDKINSACPKLWDRMYVWFDGKVNPCDADYKSYLSYGDVSKNSIKDVWNGNKINNLRKLRMTWKKWILEMMVDLCQ